jgi:hypothetical protein
VGALGVEAEQNGAKEPLVEGHWAIAFYRGALGDDP